MVTRVVFKFDSGGHATIINERVSELRWGDSSKGSSAFNYLLLFLRKLLWLCEMAGGEGRAVLAY